MEKTYEINVAANVPWGISMMNSMIGVWVYDFQGRIDLGYCATDHALRTADESGDILSKAWAHNFHGFSCYCKGFLEEAEELLLKGIDFCQSIDLIAHVFLGNLWLSDTYFDMGEYRQSQDCIEKAILLYERYRPLPPWINLGKIALARAKVMNNEMNINLAEISKCNADNRYAPFEGQMSRYIGDILLNLDEKRTSEAEDWIKRAIEADSRNGMMFHLAKDHALYAELFKRKGDASKAKDNLNKAIEIFKECGADGWVNKYKEELAST